MEELFLRVEVSEAVIDWMVAVLTQIQPTSACTHRLLKVRNGRESSPDECGRTLSAHNMRTLRRRGIDEQADESLPPSDRIFSALP